GFIVRECARKPSNFRSQVSLRDFLLDQGVTGICGIDTRALTKILREKGTMNGMITTNENYSMEDVLFRIKAYKQCHVVERTTCPESYVLPGDGYRVALMDFGAKANIARSLNQRGCQVTVYPAFTTAETILEQNPDGIMLSNGPGDPKECRDIIQEVKKLYESGIPIFAICLGHQLMALANGGDTQKMHFGHRGGNHPVKDLSTGRCYITSQNHGYVVKPETMDPQIAKPAFCNTNDGSNEGLEYLQKPVYTVQFHPEACPGPHDTSYLFDRFIQMMGGDK
ncbi:MAG: carbamoyl phosphate synthase small subunit, partial [Clostridiales bacterium]|nr:carbamoyl phosphate synthase small subunit [Clostridiales bacterium]